MAAGGPTLDVDLDELFEAEEDERFKDIDKNQEDQEGTEITEPHNEGEEVQEFLPNIPNTPPSSKPIVFRFATPQPAAAQSAPATFGYSILGTSPPDLRKRRKYL